MELAALEQLPLVRWVGTAPAVYPLLSALHVLGIGLLLAPVLLVDLHLLGLADARLGPVRLALLRMARRGLALAAGTGLPLFLVQAGDYAANPAFQAKLGVIAAALLNAGLLHWRVPDEALAPRGRFGRHVRAAACASLGLWLAVLLLGRWIAFV